MCAFMCSLHAILCISWLNKCAYKTDLVLYTREPVEHDRTVTSWDVIDACLEQSSGNTSRYYVRGEHSTRNTSFVHAHQ